MMRNVMTIELGEPDTGLWCRKCTAHSLMRFPVLSLRGDGVLPVGSIDLCPQCKHSVNRRVER